MSIQRSPRSMFRRHALATAVVLALAGAAHAQISTSTVKDLVSAGSQPAQGGLAVTATNRANGNTYRTTTLPGGSYVLSGLAPGEYDISVATSAGTQKAGAIALQVGQTASLDLSVGGAQVLQPVMVVGSAQRADVRTSEVGTNVSQKMLRSLPQSTNNFLSAADLAPGVAYSQDASGNTKIQSGAQNFDNVNVFIDGVGQKNNVLRGGLTGQDSSRGNPFPQSAIAEYKVLTQNYKAEFEQVSSAAVSAVTKSGTNQFQGEAYIDRTGTNWRARSVFEKEREAQGVPLPASSKQEYGLSLGGPIRQDALHFFLAYDGKSIDDSRQVVPRHIDLLPAGQGIVPSIAGIQGNQVDGFKEHLLFGKVDAQINDEQRVSVSLKLRRESDLVPENRDLSAPGNDKDRTNDETRLDLKHEWTRGPFLAETRIGYDNAVWNPHSSSTMPFIKYKVSTASPQSLGSSQDVIFVGGSSDAQRREQTGMYLSEDVTYTGLQRHVLKGGVKLNLREYDLSGTAFSVDTVETLIDTATGLPYYDGANCTGTNVTNGGADSAECHITRAAPPATAAFKNKQIGLYIQDDWTVSNQLELNLGLRYDYETNMLNNDYVTPADRVAALMAPDVTRFGIAPAPGQTYAQSLARGGIDIGNYISNGSSRKPFKRAVAPRIGASYDLFADRRSVLFGGWGRSFDRTMANHALDELQKNQQAGGEIWLIRNDFKMPYADQFSIGLRQALGQWNAEVTLSRIDGKNQFVWFGGNRDPNGGYANQSPIDPLWGGPNGYGTLVLGDFVGENRTNALFLKAEKPFTRDSGWGVNVAYTFSDAKTTSREWNNDIFDWTYGRDTHGWNRSTLVDKHRVVAAAVSDKLLPWGMTLAVKGTWASGNPRRITSCAAGWDRCIAVEGDGPSFRQVDVSASKEWQVAGHRLNLRADVLNVFNTVNYGGLDDWGGGPVAPGNPTNKVGGDNLNLGKPNSIRGDTRTLRVSLGYRF